MKRAVLTFVLLVVLVAGYGAEAFAEGKIKPFAQVRWRFEASNKDFNGSTAYNNFNLLRSRLGMKYMPSEDIKAVVMIQDSRVYGSESNTLLDGSADFLDLRDGYFRVNNFFKAPLDLQVGRMRVSYGDQRLIGAVEWHNIGRAFDGLIVDVHGDKFWVDLFNFTVVDSLFHGDHKDMYFYGAYANIKIKDEHKTELFATWQRRQPRRVLNRGTIGWYLNGSFGGLSYKSDLGYQFGDIKTSSSNDFATGISYGDLQQTVQAFMVTLRLGYIFKDVKTSPAIFGAVDFLSGDDNLEDDKYKVFDTMYATNHKFYGYMDYFLVIPRDTYGRGLVDAWGRFKFSPFKKTPMWLDVHYLQANKDVFVRDEDTMETENTGTTFGTEIDFVVKHTYTENFWFEAGASWFGPGEVFKAVRGTDSSTWFYIQAAFNI
jgi:hypothetical protein